ncbi:hypothetical protein CEXT_613571 [Caerostris extrusa]|uniref:Uncharacterized protein n=1 Tax=Caerostris extrusa TaxID=172846 RepID=A0AAV4Y5H9_CAEEX|nr:hypothetical protein CEXT_613571 [Caerostris extrusa]
MLPTRACVLWVKVALIVFSLCKMECKEEKKETASPQKVTRSSVLNSVDRNVEKTSQSSLVNLPKLTKVVRFFPDFVHEIASASSKDVPATHSSASSQEAATTHSSASSQEAATTHSSASSQEAADSTTPSMADSASSQEAVMADSSASSQEAATTLIAAPRPRRRPRPDSSASSQEAVMADSTTVPGAAPPRPRRRPRPIAAPLPRRRPRPIAAPLPRRRPRPIAAPRPRRRPRPIAAHRSRRRPGSIDAFFRGGNCLKRSAPISNLTDPRISTILMLLNLLFVSSVYPPEILYMKTLVCHSWI